MFAEAINNWGLQDEWRNSLTRERRQSLEERTAKERCRGASARGVPDPVGHSDWLEWRVCRGTIWVLLEEWARDQFPNAMRRSLDSA